LNDGTLLEAGGSDGTNAFNTAELYMVSKLIGLTSITVTPATSSFAIGSPQLFAATGTFTSGDTQVLSSVLWGSSSPSVLAISNDATDSGFGATVSQGTMTVTASAAGISGSTTGTVTGLAVTSILVTPSITTIPLGTTEQYDATGIYNDGSVQDLTSTATWSSSSSGVTISSSGLATGAVQGSTTIQASYGSVSGSTTLTVGEAALATLWVNPPTATIAAGTTQQYQLIGTFTDGSTQDLTNSASWLAAPSQIASISTGGLLTAIGSGTAEISATYGLVTTSTELTIGTPSPTISSISPTSGPPGTPVVITGTNFGSLQGIVSFAGGAQGSISSWNTGSAMTTVPIGASTGTIALSVEGGVAYSETFTVTPGIASVSPPSGLGGIPVTIVGTNFGTSQGTDSSVSFNGANATINTWSPTLIEAYAPANVTTGPVLVTVGGIESNPGAFTAVPSETVNSIFVSPQTLTLALGEDKRLQATDDSGRTVTPTWSSSNDTVAYVTYDAPYRVVGQATGTATLTATLGSLTAQETVTVLSTTTIPNGTPLFSLNSLDPTNSEYGVNGVGRLYNTASTGPVLAVSDSSGGVRAITLDGAEAWRVSLGSYGYILAPDNSGGFFGSYGGFLTHVNSSGVVSWYASASNLLDSAAVGEDDTLYAVRNEQYTSGIQEIDAYDGSSGALKARTQLPMLASAPIYYSSPSIISDGSVCVEQAKDIIDGFERSDLLLHCTSPSGVLTTTTLFSQMAGSACGAGGSGSCFYSIYPGYILPDANGNVLATYVLQTTSDAGNTMALHAAKVADGSSTDVVFPYAAAYNEFLPQSHSIVLGDTFFYATFDNHIFAFEEGRGAPAWNYDLAPGLSGHVIYALAGGGVLATGGNGTPLTLDDTGKATYETGWSNPDLNYLLPGFALNWSPSPQIVSTAFYDISDSTWGSEDGNQHQQSRPPKQVQFQEDQACSGFDNTTDQTWLMVPLSGTNTVKVKIRGSYDDVNFVSSDATVATVSPSAPSGDVTTLTITGVNAGTNPILVNAQSITDPSKNYAQLYVVVKPRLTKQLDMFSITESAENLVPNPPTPTSVQDMLNQTFGNQANVWFTVQPIVSLSVHYDLQPAGHPDGKLNDTAHNNDTTEKLPIILAISANKPSAVSLNEPAAAFINQFGPPYTDPKAQTVVDGVTLLGGFLSYIQNTPATIANSRPWVTSHEVGHGQGIDHNVNVSKNPLNYLMHAGAPDPTNLNPCRILRQNWSIINPTPGDGSPSN
jgi:hypothetical protein